MGDPPVPRVAGRDRPLVVVLDDIHWGEAAFLDLVEHVSDGARGASILLVAMARPDLLDARPDWGGRRTNASTISLAPLSDAECAQLIAYRLGSRPCPTLSGSGSPTSPRATLSILRRC